MSGDKWVNSIGLDIDGTLFVELENGITLAEALKGMNRTLESDLAMAIAAYHPIDGLLTYKTVTAELQKFYFKTSYSNEIVYARRNPG